MSDARKIIAPTPDIIAGARDVSERWYLNLALWSQYSGLRVDGHPFSFDRHLYLLPIYMDRSLDIVVMKSAQMGLTIAELLRCFHQALHHEAWGYPYPIKIGFYFPDKSGVLDVVRDRVEPLLASSPELQPYSTQPTKLLKRIGPSSVYFRYMAGKSTKDSIPLMSLFFDEVRLMSPRDVFQAYERVSAAEIKYKFHASTAGVPDTDIHGLFLESDQKWFYTRCTRCQYEQCLPLEFPDCIAEHTIGTEKGKIYYICKSCRLPLEDNQRGRYIPHGDPLHEVSGYQFSQLVSKKITAREIWRMFQTTDNIPEFWNAKLGMPYVDEENRPVHMGGLVDNEYQNISTLAEWGQYTGQTYMGVDQMMNLNYVTIIEVRGEERRLVWFEIIEDRDPFARLYQLMEDYSVSVCVCDSEPNTNDALKFARAFNRRVFLAKYGLYPDLVRWDDHWRPKRAHKKAAQEEFYQYRVFLDKYQSIGRTLEWIRRGRVQWPNPERLVQEALPLGGGARMPYPVMKTHAFHHYSSPIRIKIMENEEEQRYRFAWKFTMGDPHALDSLNYAITASLRRRSIAGWWS